MFFFNIFSVNLITFFESIDQLKSSVEEIVSPCLQRRNEEKSGLWNGWFKIVKPTLYMAASDIPFFGMCI